MVKVGITGGIGSGKSLVCGILEKMGVPVYYADQHARRLMNTRTDLVKGIKALLGDQAYRGGDLDRKYVADRVFNQQDLLKRLNALVHPEVREDFLRWSEKQKGAPYVVEEAALLLESGGRDDFDFIVLVEAPEELRVKRILMRNSMSEEEIRNRISNQMSVEDFRDQADVIIVNDEKQMLLPQVVLLHEKLLNRS